MKTGWRKFIMTIVAFALILGGLFACGISLAIAAGYTVFVGGILTGLGLYVGGNVSAAFVSSKKVKQVQPVKPGPPLNLTDSPGPNGN